MRCAQTRIEDLVREFQVGREAQDRWALRSPQRFAAAQGAGRFEDEIVAIEVPGRKGPTLFAKDEHNRPGTTLDNLAALKPAFRPDGTITAGNASGLNSGAAAVVLADEDRARGRGLAPAARLVSLLAQPGSHRELQADPRSPSPRGTKSSNPVPSSKELATTLTGKIEPALARNRRFESSSLQRRVSELLSLSTSAGRTPPNRTRCSSSSISASRTTDEPSPYAVSRFD
jgi:hypothetical protein